MPNQAKQRFLDLNVDEISVVDTPAVEVEFLVMKRMEDDSMDATEETVTETHKDANDGGAAEVVSVDAGASEDAAVNKALEQVAGMVENIAKAAGVKIAETTKSGPGEDDNGDGGGDGDGGEEATTKAKTKAFNPREMFGKQLKANGITGDAFTKAMADFDKQFKPFQPGASAQPPLTKDKPTTKTAETPVEEPSAEELAEQEAMKSLGALETAIQKAKRFTPAREKQLKSALEALKALFDDLQKIPPGGSPSTTVPGNMSFGASGVQALTKSIEQLTEVVNKSMEQSKANAERIEAIEKARTPSTSIEDEGGTDDKAVKKNFWGGVL